LLSRCFSGDIAVFNQFPMHFNGENPCVKLGSKWSNENDRFAGHSGVSIFQGTRVIGPAWPASSVRRHKSMADDRGYLTFVIYVRVFADFWRVFDIAVCWITYEIVANWPDFVCLLFVREYNRLKPVKYDRIVLTLNRLPANTSFATNQNGVHFHARHRHLHRLCTTSRFIHCDLSRRVNLVFRHLAIRRCGP